MTDRPDADHGAISSTSVRIMGVTFLFLAAALVYLLAAFWPVKAGAGWNPNVTVLSWQFSLDIEMRLIWLVVISAALGSYVHSVTSFASYVGNQTFSGTWIWWYILRTPIGIALALVFYFVIRAGLLSSNSALDVSPFGVSAIAGLVGMFSKQATDKLREVFDTLFRTAPGKGDDARQDKLAESPTLASVNPASVSVGTSEMPVTVTGKGFAEGSSMAVNNNPRRTEVASDTQLVGYLSREDVAQTGTLTITVSTPSHKTSNALQIEVREPE